MTLNLLWSDDKCTYAIADSARTHPALPQFEQTVLEQLQRLDHRNISVEEGALKILPLGSDYLVALCGSEADSIEFLRVLMHVHATSDAYAVVEYCNRVDDRARMDVALGKDPDEPFVVYRLPAREMLHVRRGHVHTSGSLEERLARLLATAVNENLIVRGFEHPEMNLVAGLAYATTMAVNENLSEQNIGGAFFGAAVDSQGFHWQPDITYMVYGRNFDEGMVEVSDPDMPSAAPEVSTEDRFRIVRTLVRDDVAISVSMNLRRIVAAMSRLITESPEAWISKWKDALSTGSFDEPKYYVFIPLGRGRIVIVPNNGKHIRSTGGAFFYSGDVRANLRVIPETTPYALVVME